MPITVIRDFETNHYNEAGVLTNASSATEYSTKSTTLLKHLREANHFQGCNKKESHFQVLEILQNVRSGYSSTPSKNNRCLIAQFKIDKNHENKEFYAFQLIATALTVPVTSAEHYKRGLKHKLPKLLTAKP